MINNRYAFTFGLSVFYALSTATNAANQLVESINTNTTQLVINSLLLILVAIVATVIVAMFRRKRSPVELNRVSIVSFTVIFVAVVLLNKLSLSMLIFPACMFVGFVVVPSYQEWLKQSEAHAAT
ncbi:hypothetical protein QP027_04770 [Corynebacterium breve]|uniref:Uncharacterized protein n=1 Tax=Corynebacterium breve TaxID=3049799 RepID=A0ABY8VI06_9CORY|nr:hypothetical protein [Corynebacterium breve]WIM68702.1 hypothetical protein QP027_04770 [Corynebacterium breve]